MATGEIVEGPSTQALARINPQALLAQAIEKGADIGVLERLVALAETVRAMQAKEAWYDAIAKFQAQCPPIFKEHTGVTRSYSYTYASIDDVLSVIQPVMGPLGLSVSWKLRFEAKAAAANCRISHALGHFEESGEVIIPIEERAEDGKGASPAQRVGIAMTYAQRYALKAAAGVAPTDVEDQDGKETGSHRAEEVPATQNGAVISEGQVRRYHAIARGSGWNEDQLHELLTSYRYNSSAEISPKDYDAIVDKLKQGPKK